MLCSTYMSLCHFVEQKTKFSVPQCKYKEKKQNKQVKNDFFYSILRHCVQEELRIKHADKFAAIFSVNSSQKIYIYLIGCEQTHKFAIFVIIVFSSLSFSNIPSWKNQKRNQKFMEAYLWKPRPCQVVVEKKVVKSQAGL